jgi:hypothetical protein
MWLPPLPPLPPLAPELDVEAPVCPPAPDDDATADEPDAELAVEVDPLAEHATP